MASLSYTTSTTLPLPAKDAMPSYPVPPSPRPIIYSYTYSARGPKATPPPTQHETASPTFSEKKAALYALVHQMRGDLVSDDEDDDTKDDEGSLAAMARDSIDMNTLRAFSWESKEVRSRRNRKSRWKAMVKWLERCLYSDT